MTEAEPVSTPHGAARLDYVVAGDNCPNMIEYNLDALARLSAGSRFVLYDWGYRPGFVDRLRRRHGARLEVVPVAGVDPGNYTYHWVECVTRAVDDYLRDGMVIFDTDVVVHKAVDAVFDAADWDVAATWRPEYEFGRERYGVGHWLNAGVLFVNGRRPEAVQAFFRHYHAACRQWLGREGRWYQDQVELVKLFNRCGPHMQAGPDQSGQTELDGIQVRCATLHYTDYNFFPWMRDPYAGYDPSRAHLFHFKNNWRRDCFNAVPSMLRPALMRWLATPNGNRRIWKRLLGALALLQGRPWRKR